MEAAPHPINAVSWNICGHNPQPHPNLPPLCFWITSTAKGCTLQPQSLWKLTQVGQDLEKGSLLVCCSPKKSPKAGFLAEKRCLKPSHLGSWSLAAAVKHHPQTASTWDRLHPGISYPSAPLSYEAWGGQSGEWGRTQNQARSREIGHPQGSFVTETTPDVKQRFSDRIWPSHPSFILAGRSWDVLWIMSCRRPAQMS